MYAGRTPDLWARRAFFIDRILRGAKPADLPVELPRTFDFAVNSKTAQALGLTIPPSVASQVTEWLGRFTRPTR
jgi:putative ABC transport system substrate-binding protein